MYTFEQLEILKARLTELNTVRNRLGAINAPDMSFCVRIEVNSKKYSFKTESNNKEIIDILKKSYEFQISRLENKINSTLILDPNAL